MADIVGMLDELQLKVSKNEEWKQMFLESRNASDPLSAFCKVCQNLGYEIYEMDMIVAGEDFYATMRRSTNGGGENSPLLQGEDDFYELFFAGIEKLSER